MPSRFGGDVALRAGQLSFPRAASTTRDDERKEEQRWRANHCRQAVHGVPVTPLVTDSSSTFTRRSRSMAASPSTTSSIAYETWGTLDDDHSNAILLCHAWTGDSHAVGPMGHGHPDRWMVGGCGRARVGDRHRPVVRRLRQRARRLSGLDRSRIAASGRRQAVRQQVPGRDDSRHGARSSSGWPTTCRSRHGIRSSADRWAACRCWSGRSRFRIASVRSCRSPRVRRPRHSRSRGGRSVDGRSAWIRIGAAATTTTPMTTMARGRASRLPAWSPRSRSAATTCSPIGSAASWPTGRRCATASTCGSDSRSSATSITTARSSCAGSMPTAT